MFFKLFCNERLYGHISIGKRMINIKNMNQNFVEPLIHVWIWIDSGIIFPGTTGSVGLTTVPGMTTMSPALTTGTVTEPEQVTSNLSTLPELTVTVMTTVGTIPELTTALPQTTGLRSVKSFVFAEVLFLLMSKYAYGK